MNLPRNEEGPSPSLQTSISATSKTTPKATSTVGPTNASGVPNPATSQLGASTSASSGNNQA